MIDLFDEVVSTPSKKTASDKKEVTTKHDITKLVELKAKIKSLTAQVKMLEGEIKEDALEQYNGESYILTDGNEKILFIAMDKYKVIDEDRANELIGMGYGAVVEKERVMSFNTEILERNMEIIAKAIQSLEIPREDKLQLLTKTEKWKVTKGAKDRFTKTKDLLELGCISAIKLQGK